MRRVVNGDGVSPACGAAQHGQCPGYYKTAHPCGCPCHQPGETKPVTGNSLVRYDDDTRRELCSLLGIEGSSSHITLLFKLAEHYDLDILTKEIALIPKKGPFIGVWGRLHIAHRSGRLDGLELDEEYETDTHYCVRVVVWRNDMGHPAAKVIGRVGKHEGHTDKHTGEFTPKEWPLEIARARGLRAALGFAFSIHDSFDNSEDNWDAPPDERITATIEREEGTTGTTTETQTGAGADPGSAAPPRTIVVGGHTAGQRIAIAAKEAGLKDEERWDVVRAATAGRYKRGRDVPDDDQIALNRILEALQGLRDNTIELRTEPESGEPRLWKIRREQVP